MLTVRHRKTIMTTQKNSAQAILNFMDDLKLSRQAKKISLAGEFKDEESSSGRGNVNLCLENSNSGELPIITMESHIMRGYGIPFSVFDVNRGQIILWDSDMKILSFSGEGYKFSLIRISLS